MKKLLTSLALVGATSLTGCAVETDQPGTAADGVEAVDPGGKGGGKNGPKMTVNQQNAVRSANDYLDTAPFSKKGLAEQLEFEGYKPQLARFAVNAIEVDWKQQAAAAAQNYLEMSAFSRQGLIDQLTFEGYTQQQAEHGTRQAGLR